MLPRQGVPIADGSMASNAFYAFLQDVERAINDGSIDTTGLRESIAVIARALGSPDGSVGKIPPQSDGGGQIQGLDSILTFGALPNMVQLALDGDTQRPGPTFHYSTNADGVKGWHAVADALAGSDTATLTVGADGVVTFSLPELPNAGGGTLQKTARDQYGRLAGTSEATTTDLPEGANLYHTAERAQAAVVTQAITNGDTTHAPSGDAVFDALAGKADLSRPQFTDWVGIGTAPDRPLTILSDTSTLPAGSAVLIVAGDENKERIEARSANGGDPTFQGKASLGTLAAPMALTAGESLVNLSGSGHNGVEWMTANKALIRARASESWSETANGCEWLFATTANGTTGFVIRWLLGNNGTLAPNADNTYDIGAGSNRVREVFSANGAINTSDAREKEVRGPLNEREIACAIELASAAVIYRWKAAIAEKGEAARLHCSPTVQGVIAIMEKYGLDPFRYGFVCFDEWDETPEIRDPKTDEVTQDYRPAGDRYSLRPTELAHFVMRGLAHRQDELERRMTALESE